MFTVIISRRYASARYFTLLLPCHPPPPPLLPLSFPLPVTPSCRQSCLDPAALCITRFANVVTDKLCGFPQDVFRLYAFAFCLQCLIHVPYFIKARTLYQTPDFHIRTVLDMLLHSAPPGLPLMMLLIGVISSFRLQRENMSLLYWEVLGKGACVDVVAFDKTGTITHSVVSHGGWQSCPAVGVQ